MRVLGKTILEDFQLEHADVRDWVSAWLAEAEEAEWKTPQDLRNRHRSVSFLAHNVVMFNVKGNRYRLECKVSYQSKIVRVTWAGTHSEYSKRY